MDKASEQHPSATPSPSQQTDDSQDQTAFQGWDWQDSQSWHQNWQQRFTDPESVSHQHAHDSQCHGHVWPHHGYGWSQYAHSWLQAMHHNGWPHHGDQGLKGFFPTWDAHKDKGKGWNHQDSQQRLLKPKKMLWLMAQLHSSEALTAESAVSLWVHMLPKAVEVIGSDLG